MIEEALIVVVGLKGLDGRVDEAIKFLEVSYEIWREGEVHFAMKTIRRHLEYLAHVNMKIQSLEFLEILLDNET